MVMPKAYEGNEPYIFISYAHKDSDKVIPIIQALQDRGFRVWFDAGIEAGSEWPAYIATHLMNCGCFIPFLTQNYMASDNCRQEIYFALRKKRSLLPVYLDEAELDIGLEMQLSPIQALMLQNAQGTDALLQEMYKSTKLKPCMGNAPAPIAKSAPTPNDIQSLYEKGRDLYDKKVYDHALWFLQQAAELGNTDAMVLAGSCHYDGKGTEKNVPQALRLWDQAADQGHPDALNSLGVCYYDVTSFLWDYKKAVHYLQLAVEKGSVKAIRNLGLCYQHGHGVPQDLSEAIRLFRSAADQGNAAAMNNLGLSYEKGEGVPQNLDTAFTWFDKAASNGSAAGAYNLGRFYEQEKCFMAQIVDDPMGLAKKWYQTAAERGSAAAKNRLRQLS